MWIFFWVKNIHWRLGWGGGSQDLDVGSTFRIEFLICEWPLSKSPFILSLEVAFTRWESSKTSSKCTHNKTPIMFKFHCFRSFYIKTNVKMKFQSLVKYAQYWIIFRYELSQNRTQKLTISYVKTDAFP